jgi:hypothetical protein
VNIATQVPEGKFLPAGSPLNLGLGENLKFSARVEGLQVPTSWATWSGGNPAVLFTVDSGATISGNFGPHPVVAVGLKIEPNPFAVLGVSVTTLDGGTHTLLQNVNGQGGAAFFGWIGDAVQIDIGCACEGTGFAMGDMVIGGCAGQPGVANCRGQSVSALANKYGGMDAAPDALGFTSVEALQASIKSYCSVPTS